MNWVDALVFAILVVSAVLGLMRGFVREVMGIGAWVGAALIAFWGGPQLKERMLAWTGSADWAAPLAYAAVFLGALVLMSVVSGLIGGVVRGSVLGSIDRTLGIVFGLLRGAALVVVTYIGAGLLVMPEHWPTAVLQARARPLAAEGADWLVRLLPKDYRPPLPVLPPDREPRAADLSQPPAAQGRAHK